MLTEVLADSGVKRCWHKVMLRGGGVDRGVGRQWC